MGLTLAQEPDTIATVPNQLQSRQKHQMDFSPTFTLVTIGIDMFNIGFIIRTTDCCIAVAIVEDSHLPSSYQEKFRIDSIDSHHITVTEDTVHTSTIAMPSFATRRSFRSKTLDLA